MSNTAASRARRSIGRGHNSRLEQLEKRVRIRQAAAQKAWLDLMKAQLAEDAPWARVLVSATMSGVRAETLRIEFDVSPSTFSRWMSGHHAPSQSLRTRLGTEMIRLAEQSQEQVPVLDEAPGETP
jgi:hypothetical protein